MATVSALHARDYAVWGHLLIIEGLDYAFTDVSAIAGTTYLGSGRTVLSGLTVPKSVVIETDPRTGLLRENKATFELLDTYDDVLANLFRASFDTSDLEQVTQRVSPTTTFASDSVTIVGSSTTTIYDRHLGLERIGPAGERRHHYITPSDAPPGLDHPWIGGQDLADVPPLYVSDDPYAFAGRRVGLYRIVYDPDTETWPDLSDQYDGGSLIWVGTLTDRGRMLETGRFKIECSGPASWTRRTLNAHRAPDWRLLRPAVELASGEKGVAVWFNEMEYGGNGNLTSYDASLFKSSKNITGTDYSAVAQEIRDLVRDTVDGVAGAVNSNGSTNYNDDGDAAFGGATASISLDDGTVSQNYGVMWLCLHIRVWAMLGWDPKNQPLLRVDSDKFAEFVKFDPTLTIDTHGVVTDVDGQSLDWDGYYTGVFHTFNPDTALVPLEGADYGGATRVFNSLYPDGAVTLLPSPQTIPLGVDDVYIEGQKTMRPSATETTTPQIGGSDVDAMGWWIFRGQIARGVSPFDGGIEFSDYFQVARCSWVDSNGQIGEDSNNQTAIHVEKWEDPRAFGIDERRMTAAWVAGGSTSIWAAPMVVFAEPYIGSATEPDHAHRIITRILLSSGTVGDWTPLGWPPAPGTNQPSSATGDQFWGGDLDIADMGLAIPSAAVDYASFRACGDSIGLDSPLNRCKYAYLGPVSSEDILSELMSSRGWAFSWKRASGDKHPSWGCFGISDHLSPSDVEITLTEADKAGKVADNRSWISPTEIRYGAPVDTFSIETRHNPIEQSLTGKDKARSLDREARGRSGRITYDVKDGGLSNPDLFQPSESKWLWSNDWRNRFARELGDFYARKNPFVSMRVSAPQGQFLYPGTVVSITDPRVLNPDGTYGITSAVGRVIRTELILSGEYAGSTVAGVILQQDQLGSGAGTGVRHWAPSARVYSWDSTNKKLWIGGSWEGDWLGMGGSHADTTGFTEPSWSTSAGTAKIRIKQSEDGGATWPSAFDVTADISAVTAADPSITYTAESGTIYRDTDKIVILDDYDNQTAATWPTAVFIAIANELTSQFGTGPTDAWRLS